MGFNSGFKGLICYHFSKKLLVFYQTLQCHIHGLYTSRLFLICKYSTCKCYREFCRRDSRVQTVLWRVLKLCVKCPSYQMDWQTLS